MAERNTDNLERRPGRSRLVYDKDQRTIVRTPYIARKVDGPMLVMGDGGVHFLTWWERVQFALGLTDAAHLDRKHGGRHG